MTDGSCQFGLRLRQIRILDCSGQIDIYLNLLSALSLKQLCSDGSQRVLVGTKDPPHLLNSCKIFPEAESTLCATEIS